MEVTVAEFRKNMKQYLDLTLTGERVLVNRGGIQYQILPAVRKAEYVQSRTTIEESGEVAYVPMEEIA